MPDRWAAPGRRTPATAPRRPARPRRPSRARPVTVVRRRLERPTARRDVGEQARPEAGEPRTDVGAGLGQDGQPGDQQRLHRPDPPGAGAAVVARVPARASRTAASRSRSVRRAERLGDGEHRQRQPAATSAAAAVRRRRRAPAARRRRRARRPGRRGRAGGSASMQVVPADDGGDVRRRGSAATRSATAPAAGQDRGRVQRQPRHQHEGPLVRARVRQGQLAGRRRPPARRRPR